MMDLYPATVFLQENQNGQYYVGFLKSPKVWFPLAILSNPNEKMRLDTLCVSRSCRAMTDAVKGYAGRIDGVEQTFVQFLLTEEIKGLLEQYGLDQIAVIAGEYEGGPSGSSDCGDNCSCGCGCG
jgi:hypothetical protein